jgi:hypothetical protein
MPSSGRDYLRYVFETVEGLRIESRTRSLSNLIAECRLYLDSRRKDADSWKVKILTAMSQALENPLNLRGLETRYNAFMLCADRHPDRHDLLTELARRALLAEYLDGAASAELSNFADRMEQLNTGETDVEQVNTGKTDLAIMWDEEWARLARRLGIAALEGA